MCDTAGSAAAPTARRKNVRRNTFMRGADIVSLLLSAAHIRFSARRAEAISESFPQAPRSPLLLVESSSFRQPVPWHGGLVEGATRPTTIDPAPVRRRTPSGRCGNRAD